MHLAWSTSLQQQQQSKQVCSPFAFCKRPSFAKTSVDPEPISLPISQKELYPETYSVFPQCSVNLITCSSNSGKTRFLHQVICHRRRFFQHADQIKRIIFVNGNQRDKTIQPPWSGEKEEEKGLEIISLTLDEFSNFVDELQINDLLVLDDILQPNETIQYIITYGAHHIQLASVFIVTQSCLGSPLYSLIKSVHNLVLLFGNSATTRLAQHLIQSFFLCTDTKAYLKSIFGVAEKKQSTVILKLNAVASYRPHSQILALEDVQHLFDSTAAYCWAYPELSYKEAMERRAMSHQAEMPSTVLEEGGGEHVNEAFVLLPASRVKKISESVAPQDDCLKNKEKEWNDMTRYLEAEIETIFPFKKWNAAKNLTRSLLRCNDLCISPDYRTVYIREKPKLAFSIVDFLVAATRKNGPGESAQKVNMYKPLVQVLIKHHVPHAFIVNKLMLPSVRYTSKRGGYKRFEDEDYYY